MANIAASVSYTMDRYGISKDGTELTTNSHTGNDSSTNPPPVEYVGLAHPSDGYSLFMTRGTMNIIPYIFAKYHEHDTSEDIYDFKANTTAALIYIADRYDMDDDDTVDYETRLAPFTE
ncbi:hypothetical protein [Mycobacteroides abscessus]|uniref:hypothetical protein n=1 Tax=Mycobacteroides abscessus TaxID=36809 RepID=UPI0010514B8E|nr:hypothetical protein [Mycobacteroides abscessus]